MNAEIIAVGSELTTGAKLDTNSQWLSLELAAVGITVDYQTTVADDREAMNAVLRCAVDRCDVVLITGGLGPTLDDLTRYSLADVMRVELMLHEPSLEFIKSLFARRNINMPERNVVQAKFPQGSEPITNPRGTAPGIWAEIPRAGHARPCLVAAMPGVPSEMKRMFLKEVLSRLPGGNRVIRYARIHCFGLGESAAEEMLGELTARGRDPEVGITVHEATITLRIVAAGETAEACAAKIEATRALIRERMGKYVFGEEDQELQHVVVSRLGERHATLSTAEAGTGGLMAHWLTEVPGFESCFSGGLIVPSDASKIDLLGVDRNLISRVGANSEEVAGAMALGCRERFGSDFALSVTECPRFEAEAPAGEAPFAFIALAGADLLKVRKHMLVGDPAIAKSRAVKAALDMLRRQLM
ncbi:MAG: CinA family nicotinamide mononucleotide deamidase-related protein [Planctomycetaceae bacterium]